MLAQIYYMLNETLSKDVKDIVLKSLITRIVEPMRLQFSNNSWVVKHHYWSQTDNNWNVVCWTNVAFVALTIIEDQYERDYFIRQAFQNTQLFLNNILEDGYFNEGNYYKF